MPTITPCLWFVDQAEAAADLYVSIFPRSSVLGVVRYPEGGQLPAGTVMLVEFELDGVRFTALNGGPHHSFNDAVSFQVPCADQGELDRVWERLGDGGRYVQCGWLQDRFGVSWQVVPADLGALMGSTPEQQARSNAALMQMVKIDIAALEAARDGVARP